jgi:DNA replicative helicase MCM subunit Mcm2 (Cdc46/Mcm family)
MESDKHTLINIFISVIICHKCGHKMRVEGRHYRNNEAVTCSVCGTKAELELEQTK